MRALRALYAAQPKEALRARYASSAAARAWRHACRHFTVRARSRSADIRACRWRAKSTRVAAMFASGTSYFTLQRGKGGATFAGVERARQPAAGAAKVACVRVVRCVVLVGCAGGVVKVCVRVGR